MGREVVAILWQVTKINSFVHMKIVFTALAIFFTTCILAQDINCQDFRNGDFKHIGPDGSITFISRKGNMQTEMKAGMESHSN